jgi:fucose permease
MPTNMDMTTVPEAPARPNHPPGTGRARASLIVLVLVFVGFISLGLPDGLLGVAFPSIRQTFGVPLDALGAVFLTTVCGYLAASLAASWVVDRIGVAMLLSLSAFGTAVSLLGYALAPSWWIIVALGLVAGLAAGAIDTGLNSYVALAHSPRLLAWLHACFGLGAASGPVIMTTVLEAGQPWRLGYAIVGVAQVGLGICFLVTRGRWQVSRDLTPPAPLRGANIGCADIISDAERGEQTSSDAIALPHAGALRLRSEPAVWLSVILFLIYTGVETTAGSWAYTLFVEGRAISPQMAGLAVSAFWGALALGRVLAGLIANDISPVTLLRFCMFGMLAGAVILWADLSPWLSFAGLGLIGLAAAPIFPAMIGVTPARFGAAQATTLIGMQVAAASLGITVLPAMAGVLAARINLEIIPLLLIVSSVLMIGVNESVLRLVDRLHRQ